MQGLLRRLHASAASRLSAAYAPRSRGPLSSALRALAAFAAKCPERVLFKSPASTSKEEAAAWNEWTFILFAMYMEATPSGKTGRVVKGDCSCHNQEAKILALPTSIEGLFQ